MTTTICPRCATSTRGCRRCGTRLCMEHLPFSETCAACDLAYYESRDRLHQRAWFALGFALPWIAFVAIMATATFPRYVGGMRSFSTGSPQLDFAIMTAIISVFAGKAVLALRRWVHRREFDEAASASRRSIVQTALSTRRW